MTSIEVNESSDNDVYTFILKEKGTNSVIDLTNYTGITMDVVSKDLKTNHGTIADGTPGMSFGTKASGEMKLTTNTTDPWPTIGVGVDYVDVLGQIKITGSGLVTVIDTIEIRVNRDYTLIT